MKGHSVTKGKWPGITNTEIQPDNSNELWGSRRLSGAAKQKDRVTYMGK